MSRVTIESVVKKFGPLFTAVDNIDLEAEEGEFLVLLGPSGCGKTTTLRMVAGFETPTSGRITIGGQDVTQLPVREREIGMVFQNYALFPNMTVRENIAFGLEQRKMARADIDRRVEQMIDLAHLQPFASRFPAELSGGQQQRVALMRALAIKPQILLMDEPLGALDLKLRETMQIELKQVQQELGITTILVTHDQQEAMTLADRIVVMAEGRIQQVGTPSDLYERPANRFVADFIGQNNFLSGVITERTGTYAVMELGDRTSLHVSATGACGAKNVTLAVRPEHLRLTDGTGTNGDNRLYGQVSNLVYFGNFTHYFVDLHAGQQIVVESPGQSQAFAKGAQVCVSWDATHGHLLEV